MSGGQILDGDVELFVLRNIPMIPSKVSHCPTEEGMHSENKDSHIVYTPNYSCSFQHVVHILVGGSKAAQFTSDKWSPVVLLLDGGSQLLVEALQVCVAHQ